MSKKELLFTFAVLLVSAIIIFVSGYFLFSFAKDSNKKNDKNEISGKIDSIQDIKEINDDKPENQAKLGESFLQSGEYEKAEEIFSRLATKDKANDNYQTSWALALYNLGEYEKAEEIYRGIIQKEEQAFAYNGLANVLRDRGTYEAGLIDDKTEAEKIKMRYWQEAEEKYLSAISLDEKFLVSYNNLAQLLSDQKRIDEAIEILEQGIAANPKSEELKESLAIIKNNSAQDKEEDGEQ